MNRVLGSVLAILVHLGCTPPPAAVTCTPEDPSPGALPARLSETGLLCDDGEGLTDSGDAWFFQPNYPLWTDGLHKERRVLLMEGAPILAGESGWDLPIGARLSKTIFADGAPVETRVSWKMEDGWMFGAYAWSGDDAELVGDEGATLDSGYEVPSAAACLGCHGEEPKPNAFNAWQLQDAQHGVSAESLLLDGVLRGPNAEREVHVAGDATIAAGLGYLASNCGSCHSDRGMASSMALRLDRPAAPSLEETPFFRSAVGQSAQAYDELLVAPGAPDASLLYQRMVGEDGFRMPPLGTHVHDQVGINAVRDLIRSL